MHEFPCPKPTTVRTRTGGGLLTVIAEPRDTATVKVTPFDASDTAQQAAADTRVEMTDDHLLVEAPGAGAGWIFRRGGKVHVEIHVPLDCRLEIRTNSADVRCAGRYSSGSINGASAEVGLELVTGDLSANSASGAIWVDRVGGALSSHIASGDLSAGSIGGDLVARTASGNVDIGAVAGSARVATASGNVDLGVTSAGAVKVTTASGNVTLGVERGTPVWLDLQSAGGRTTTDLDVIPHAPKGLHPDLRVTVRTASGDITVFRALAAPTPAAA
jgi:DUF4097 and DUF4098 domain-containing protein YvlB